MCGGISMRKNKTLTISVILLSLILLGCLLYIGQLIAGYLKVDEEYNGIHDSYVTEPAAGETDAEDEYVSPIPDRDIDIDGLLSANPDFIGWLYYEDGNIDYPVAKEREDDINGYLHKTFEGNKSSAGCLFIPYDADERFTDFNTFIYGHNMKNGSMFGSLKKLIRTPDESYKDPYFYVYAKNGDRIMYRVISTYITHKDSAFFAIPQSITGYDEYIESILSAGSMDGRIPFTDAETEAMERHKPIVTFSVCHGRAGTSNRQLVHGVEVLREHKDQ